MNNSKKSGKDFQKEQIVLGNGDAVLERIKVSKRNDPNRNKSYSTLVQANTYSGITTNATSVKENASFIVQCKLQ